ncbi:3'-5' exonuclease [Bacillus thuringiensis]|uniref:DNA 3'-5' helicase n=2 Tax=Bacillus thuringiensis TaxID=1428 RepID=A0A9W3JA66_BACTU|nr:3'-5' exonuclease [Bacillus thuringiensis]EEM43156.1 DNA helicase [Bacillus thuringiensis serovar sotto str. T04001]AFQ16716.1 DNA helicase [Bacillus thuringiensis HD-771]MEB4889816.1 3'-5' exonuclease [Bacillus thuringiensis]MEC2561167.1 3'-5' exonuclease [Bacillus thuringiensis]MEC2722900.1 3'-5' exonuclease [Bacillus thuringiensis]
MSIKKIDLTQKQKDCVTFKPLGSLLVRGIPGSGKSTIIMARAQYLRKHFPDESVLIITFSRPLTNYVRQLSLKTGEYAIEASTFHSWAQSLLKDTNYPHTKLRLGKERNEIIQFAINIIKKNNPSANFPSIKSVKNERYALMQFISDEIEWIKGSNIKNKDEYMSITRAGRGRDIRVTKKHRDTIYTVLQKYNELLQYHPKHQGIDSEDLARILLERINSVPINNRPDHILIDEAQDLNTLQLLSISTAARKSLTVGADKGQQIYRRTFTWKQAGIDVSGNRSRFLNETFRSTKQIIQLANDFQAKDSLFVKDEDYIQAKEPETEGKLPEVCFCKDGATEKKVLLTHVQEIRTSFPNHTIGVISSWNEDLDKAEESLKKTGVPVVKISSDQPDILSPGVKLVTSLSCKGLEFDHVIVMGLKQGKLPYINPNPGEDEEDFLSRERKKFYVAMTRAKKTLLITAVQPYSSFVNELNLKYYRPIEKQLPRN